MQKPKERVLIVGSGFGGTKAALELAGDPRFAVTLLTNDLNLRYYPAVYHTRDRRQAGQFQPAFDRYFCS